jgi:hypothetical protein
VSKKATVLVLLALAAILGAVAYFAVGIDVPNGVQEMPVEINLDW